MNKYIYDKTNVFGMRRKEITVSLHYLSHIDNQAENMLFPLTKQIAEGETVTEKLNEKALCFMKSGRGLWGISYPPYFMPFVVMHQGILTPKIVSKPSFIKSS